MWSVIIRTFSKKKLLLFACFSIFGQNIWPGYFARIQAEAQGTFQARDCKPKTCLFFLCFTATIIYYPLDRMSRIPLDREFMTMCLKCTKLNSSHRFVSTTLSHWKDVLRVPYLFDSPKGVLGKFASLRKRIWNYSREVGCSSWIQNAVHTRNSQIG